MDIIGRLNSFVNYLGLSSSKFADEIGLPRPSISQILNGRNKKLSNEFISLLHSTYPSLNILWLLFGEGDMILFSGNTSQQNKTEYKEKFHEDDTSSSTDIKQDLNEVAIEVKNYEDGEMKCASGIKSIILLYEDNTFTILKSRNQDLVQ